MCGRFTQAYSWREVHEALSLIGPALNLEPRYNVAPSQDAAVVRLDDEGRRLAMLHWGLIPFWAKDEKIGYRTINARCEGIESKPAFREAFRHRRCLIPADGFYEWTGPKGDRQPYRITMKGGGLFAFAGLWERWEKGAEPVESFTIITCPAEELIDGLHDRMPVIVPPNNYDAWLAGSAGTELLKPYPADEMKAYPVSRAVGNTRHDDASLIEPVG
jgi:putative SOS response-associated peptidase YedK